MSASCTSFQPSSDPNLLVSGSHRYIYDVFISFRGSDTRNGFVGHLYAHLVRKGLIVFKDDIELRRGQSISPQLLQAIQDSRVSIVVFSKDYASSTWCLDEMAAIDECRAELRQTVFPIFYDVDPSHVRKQNGAYENAFVVHAETFKYEPHRIDGWKKAMTCLAGLGGTDVRNKPEFEMIETIVQDVINTLNPKLSGFYDHLIGVRPRVEALERLLNLKSEDNAFRVLGIWGMDGIGKTTLANVLYDTISYQFGACCFIENLSTIYRDGDAIAVKKQILHQTLKEKNLDAYNLSEISKIVINRLYNMKSLLVLDDVDQFEQLEELHINPKKLHPGSRIIITTRDVHILELYGANIIHEVELMNDNDARELLCRKAFKNGNSSNDYAELISNVLRYAQGLPLAIKVMGSFLYNKNTTQWKDTLKGLEKNPNSEIMKVLRSSFEKLEGREKEIFLHIACFFEGEREDYVKQVLHAFGLQYDIGISLLAKKSFITIRNQKIYMHKMLQELGKHIVREQHPNEPRLWSRLWLYCDLLDAVRKPEAINAEAIILNQREDVSKFKQLRDEDLSKMENLKVLILNHSNFSGSSKFLPNSLRYLLWNGCPMTYLSSKFQPYNFIELNLPNSSIVQLWKDIQDLPFLKRMDISNSKNLKVTPRFEGMQYLEQLDLTGCINLSVVHPSIGLLTKLEFLSLRGCTSLVNLDFGNAAGLRSLKVLRLSECKKLKNTPDFSGLIVLQYLDMDRCTSLSTIHESIGLLTKLEFLSLRGCSSLVNLDFGNAARLWSLKVLHLSECKKLKNTPDFSGLIVLQYLDMDQCTSLSTIHESIGLLTKLEFMSLRGCSSLVNLDFGDAARLWSLKVLRFSDCKKLINTPDFSGLIVLQYLDMDQCTSLFLFHPSIGLLTKLEFLSLRGCSSLVNLDFGDAARLWSLKVLRFSDCKKLINTPDFSGLVVLQYLDMDRCASLLEIHESIGALAYLNFISLRDCKKLVKMPVCLNTMIATLDLCGTLWWFSPYLQSLIFLDLSFCNIVKLPDAIGELRCLERLNLQGNNFTQLPITFGRLRNLSYLNLSHCHKLQSLPWFYPEWLDLPTNSGPSNSVGRYYKTTSGSHNHRSGLYVFDSPNCMKVVSFSDYECHLGRFFSEWKFQKERIHILGEIYVFDSPDYIPDWILRLLKEPLHFRCGFDIVLPLQEETTDSNGNCAIPKFYNHHYKGGSIVRIIDSINFEWLGFIFYVTFELHDHNQQSPSSQLPHPFYLSFESEYTEERFDMPLNLELNKVDGQHYLWMIYISREHCHFVKTGAHITFKARQGLIIKEWGLRVINKKDTDDLELEMNVDLPLEIVKVKQRSGSSCSEPKIQLPYNCFVSDEDEAERDEAKAKETHLFNLDLLTECSQ